MNDSARLPPLALITGTSRGLGLATTRQALDAGFEVHGFSRRGPRGKLARNERFHHHKVDLSDSDAVQACFSDRLAEQLECAARRRVGLINNAGSIDIETVEEISAKRLSRVFALQAIAPILIHGWLLRHTSRRQRTRIIDVSSGAATDPVPGWVGYCASKAALDMAGQVLGAECSAYPQLQGRDLAVVSFSPGVVDTKLQSKIRRAADGSFPLRDRFVQLHEAGELVAPAEPAAAIIELLKRDDLPRFSRMRFGD